MAKTLVACTVAAFLAITAHAAHVETSVGEGMMTRSVSIPEHAKVIDVGVLPSLMGEGHNYSSYETPQGDPLYSMSTKTDWADYGDEIVPVLFDDAGLKALLENGYPSDGLGTELDDTRLRYVTQVAVWAYLEGDAVLDSAVSHDEALDPYGLIPHVSALVDVGRSASDAHGESGVAGPIVSCEGEGKLVLSDGEYRAGPYSVNLGAGEECYLSFGDGSPAHAELDDGREEVMFEGGERFWIVVSEQVSAMHDPLDIEVTARVMRRELVRYEISGRSEESERLVGLVPCDVSIITRLSLPFGGLMGDVLNSLPHVAVLILVAVVVLIAVGLLVGRRNGAFEDE